MKRLILLSFVFLAMIACNSPRDTSTEQVTEEQPTELTEVGGDTDEHGCLTAAGEIWSDLQQACIKVFEIAQRLNPVNVADGEEVISAFILFDDEFIKAELFLPENQGVAILEVNNEGAYQNDVYLFNPMDAALYVNGEKKFDGRN